MDKGSYKVVQVRSPRQGILVDLVVVVVVVRMGEEERVGGPVVGMVVALVVRITVVPVSQILPVLTLVTVTSLL
tara:strand:+ start:647 stop:868 length:222 start_codon:yes stop_codon:yes gene_type:complete